MAIELPHPLEAQRESKRAKLSLEEVEERVEKAVRKALRNGETKAEHIDCGKFYAQICDSLRDLGYSARFHDGCYVDVSWTEADIKWERSEEARKHRIGVVPEDES